MKKIVSLLLVLALLVGAVFGYKMYAEGQQNRNVNEPVVEPAAVPTAEPTAVPTAEPVAVPTAEPTAIPTAEPVAVPTAKPTAVPTAEPVAVPTAEPTAVPTAEPAAVPTAEPTAVPTAEVQALVRALIPGPVTEEYLVKTINEFFELAIVRVDGILALRVPARNATNIEHIELIGLEEFNEFIQIMVAGDSPMVWQSDVPIEGHQAVENPSEIFVLCKHQDALSQFSFCQGDLVQFVLLPAEKEAIRLSAITWLENGVRYYGFLICRKSSNSAPVVELPTLPPVTQAPATQAPVTQAPVTQAPVTQAPVTQAPVTQAPVTQAPVTQAPVVELPTLPPVTQAPATQAPATQAPAHNPTPQPTPVVAPPEEQDDPDTRPTWTEPPVTSQPAHNPVPTSEPIVILAPLSEQDDPETRPTWTEPPVIPAPAHNPVIEAPQQEQDNRDERPTFETIVVSLAELTPAHNEQIETTVQETKEQANHNQQEQTIMVSLMELDEPVAQQQSSGDVQVTLALEDLDLGDSGNGNAHNPI